MQALGIALGIAKQSSPSRLRDCSKMSNPSNQIGSDPEWSAWRIRVFQRTVLALFEDFGVHFRSLQKRFCAALPVFAWSLASWK